jgi:hypothetical protein
MSDFGGWTTPESQVTYFKPADHAGHLIGFLAVKKMDNIFDEMRNAEVQRAIVEMVDFDDGGIVEHNVSVQHPAIVRKLSVGGPKVLGRCKKIKTKAGFDAWVLEAPSEDDLQRASRWSDEHGHGKNQESVSAAADAIRQIS